MSKLKSKKAETPTPAERGYEPSQTTVYRVPVDDLILDPANARKHPRENIEIIKGSLVEFGQPTAIVADANLIVRKGNGTLMAARELGWTHVDTTFPDAIAGIKAITYSIVDNNSSDKSEWDRNTLATTLEAIRNEDAHLLAVTGFQDAEVSALMEEIAGATTGLSLDYEEGHGEGFAEGEQFASNFELRIRLTAEKANDENLKHEVFSFCRKWGVEAKFAPVD
jgi:hypothetical protein